MKNLTRRAVFIAAALLVLVIVTGTASALWLYRNAALAAGERHLRNIAVALAEQLRQGVLTVDIAVRATIDEYRKHGTDGAAAARALHDDMRERVAALPQLRSLLVIGPDGRLIAHSGALPTPAVGFADRDHFAAHRDGRTTGLFLGAPVMGRVIQEWTYTMSRRMNDADGGFGGVVTAAFAVTYFQDLHRSLELGPMGRVFLFRSDGVLLASFPPAGAELGQRYSTHELFNSALPRATSGVLRARGFQDNEARVIAYHGLSDYPLLVAVSSTRDYVLREWRRQSLYVGSSALAAVAFVLFAAFLLARQLRVTEELAGAMQQSERRWLAAVEAAEHGVWEWDIASGRASLSPHYHRILGCGEGEIPETREGWHELVHPEDRATMEGISDALLDGRLDTFSTEMRLRSKSGGWRWVLIRGMALSRDAQGRAQRVLGTLTDVTDQQQSQQQLRENEARLNAIVESAMDAIVTIDEDHRIVLFNRAAEKMFRCPARGAPGREAIGAPLDRFIPERYREPHRAHIERFGSTGVTMRRMGENIVLAGLRADGEEFPIDASISQVAVGGRRYYTVILRDITERQKAAAALEESHRELRELYAVMHEIREAERIRIARELHDELAQWLTALKMDVSWIAARLPKDMTRLVEKTAKMKEVVDTTVAAVRRIAADLRPVMIDDLGLIPAIEHLLHAFSERTGIVVSLDTRTDAVEFRDPLATAVYRMVQEALTNVARHAEAARVEVGLVVENEDLFVEVRDNGRGIDEAALRKGKSYGVLGIRERAQTLGGSARIYSSDEGGTTVEIKIPLHTQRAKESAA